MFFLTVVESALILYNGIGCESNNKNGHRGLNILCGIIIKTEYLTGL